MATKFIKKIISGVTGYNSSGEEEINAHFVTTLDLLRSLTLDIFVENVIVHNVNTSINLDIVMLYKFLRIHFNEISVFLTNYKDEEIFRIINETLATRSATIYITITVNLLIKYFINFVLIVDDSLKLCIPTKDLNHIIKEYLAI